ncbi:nucleotidyl transferase AbiEii/AbiGii toxin family protein [Micromonospora haikouensis]|uniref:nucleotidyl transferase AbiEii/AbiGii toxin family protein n=1 Tax=Micromonospora haikouensis TaxID=686309 RepID=UPI0033C393D8
MEELHRQLLRIGFDAGDDLGLVLAGGYAMCAHELVSRPSQDIDFATASALPLSTVVSRLADAYRHAGFSAQAIEVSPARSSRAPGLHRHPRRERTTQLDRARGSRRASHRRILAG